MKSKILCASLVLFSSLGVAKSNIDMSNVRDRFNGICKEIELQRECNDYLITIAMLSLSLGRLSALCEVTDKKSIIENKIDCDGYIGEYKKYKKNLNAIYN